LASGHECRTTLARPALRRVTMDPVARGRFHLTFPENLVDQPVIYELGKRFEVVTNIRRANAEERFGWVILDLDGPDQAVEDAVAWLADRGVQINRIDGDIVEG
jgi:ABC-type methionine transport system ATPase subunit